MQCNVYIFGVNCNYGIYESRIQNGSPTNPILLLKHKMNDTKWLEYVTKQPITNI